MKNKNHKHMTIHQMLERLAHHRIVLTCVLAFMGLNFIKYETQLFHIMHSAYGEGFGMVSAYTPHHEEVRGMPIQYGNNVRSAYISGE